VHIVKPAFCPGHWAKRRRVACGLHDLQSEAGDQILTRLANNVMPHQLPKSEHGQAAVVDLVRLARNGRFLVHVDGEGSIVSGHGGGDRIIDGTNGKEGSDPELVCEFGGDMLLFISQQKLQKGANGLIHPARDVFLN
jgi:hypothetical protein